MRVTKRQLTAKQLMMISSGGLVFSLIFHVLAVLNIYSAAVLIIMTLTAGILFVWFEAGAQIKQFQQQAGGPSPWHSAVKLCPVWLKHLTIIFVLYAFINFAANMETNSSSGYLNFNVSWARMRIISGFWLAFYMYGVSAGYVSLKRDQKEIK